MNTLQEFVKIEEFAISDNKKKLAVIPCSFSKELEVECIVQDRLGRVKKKFVKTVTETTKELTLDTSGFNEDFYHVWFNIEGQTFVRDLKLSNGVAEEKEGSISRFLRFFT